MNEKRVIISASTILSIIYICSTYQNEFIISTLSILFFISGTIIALKKSNPFFFIIFGEILVINNYSILSSLIIQLILGLLFSILYISKDIHVLGPLAITYISITSLFAYWTLNLQVFEYTFICMAVLITGYVITEIQWRKIKRKNMENI